MKISRQDIEKLGTLARLELTEKEVDSLAKQLPKIVDYVGHLQNVDTTAVAEKTPVTSSLRSDDVQVSATIDAILDQAPEKTGSSWKVDAVFS